ncbi:MAG: HAMP domain-containing protein [Chloroflexi bacterium]|nr:HAMP domain-containing protein [Chloroflexota bacterium]
MPMRGTMRTWGAALRRLRWKMTLSYTIVTVGALLLVEILVLGGLGLFTWNIIRHSDTLPLAMEQQLLQQAAPILRPHLEQSPPDAAAVRSVLSLFDTAEVRGGEEGGVQFSLGNMPDSAWLVVIDREGTLLAASGTRFRGGEGEPLETSLPGVGSLVQGALRAGLLEERYRIDGGEMVLLTPVTDEAGEEVLGAIGMVFPLPVIDLGIVRQMVPLILGSLVVFTLLAGVAGTVFGYLTSRGMVRRLGALADATGAWSRGDFTAQVRDHAGDEVSELARRLNLMAEQLENLLETRNRLAVLEERNRLARDLHDSAKQQAFAAAAQIGAARALVEANPAAARERLAEAEELVYALRQELSGLIDELRPPALHGQGLAGALQDLADGWSRRTGIRADVQVSGEKTIPLATEQTLLRIAQEALANVSRHSGAANARIGLRCENGHITMTIEDDGRGFEPATAPRGVGLQSMRERAESLPGGRLTIESAPGAGARVRVACRLDEPAEGKR